MGITIYKNTKQKSKTSGYISFFFLNKIKATIGKKLKKKKIPVLI